MKYPFVGKPFVLLLTQITVLSSLWWLTRLQASCGCPSDACAVCEGQGLQAAIPVGCVCLSGSCPDPATAESLAWWSAGSGPGCCTYSYLSSLTPTVDSVEGLSADGAGAGGFVIRWAACSPRLWFCNACDSGCTRQVGSKVATLQCAAVQAMHGVHTMLRDS